MADRLHGPGAAPGDPGPSAWSRPSPSPTPTEPEPAGWPLDDAAGGLEPPRGSGRGAAPAAAAEASSSGAGEVVTTDDQTEQAAETADGRLIRSVRNRLLLWSGGSTLLVLVVLGVALYLTVASTLAASGEAVLDNRAQDLLASFQIQAPGEGSPTDFIFGGGGTFGIVITPDGRIYGPRQFVLPDGLPDQAAMTAAGTSGRDVRDRNLAVRNAPDGDQSVVPIRQLTQAAQGPTGTFYVQVIQDRSAEVRTLQTLLVVLAVGGALVFLVAVGFGGIYARRALVPIRQSLASQRAALRRQREFAADASHELRTPLTVIRSSVEHLRRHPERTVESAETLDDIDAEVSQLTNLVDELLLLARSDSGAITLERIPLQLDDVATESAAAMAVPASARQVRIIVDPEPAPIVGDPGRLRQLVTILLDNAIRHSPADGEVRVIVRAESGMASVAVDDAGPGVRPEDAARIFDRFWRAPGAPAGGTGLGLAIAKWIAEHHAGTISVGRSPAGGARFEVRLPVTTRA
jgi:two-component system, OmpR family, sensor histidine kinase CiaH